MKTRSNRTPGIRRRRGCRATQLLECIVYIGVLLVIINSSGLALFRVLDHLRAVRHQSDQVTAVLSLGERWRAEVRAAGPGGALIETNEACELHLPTTSGMVAYVSRGGRLLRRGEPDAAWRTVLSAVTSSRFVREQRDGVVAWRWELELAPWRPTRRAAPLRFTFQAVPGTEVQP